MNGLKTQLMMFIVPVIAAAILLSSMFSFYASTEFIKAQRYEELHSIANTASMAIEQMLIDEMKFASIIATQTQFIELLKPQRDDEILIDAAQARLDYAQSIIGTDQEITIIDKNGKAVASTSSELVGKDQSQDPLFINSRERTYIKDAYVDENNRQLFGIAAPIFDNNEEYIGSVAIDIPSKKLDVAIHEMKTIGQTGEMIVFNRNGYAITSTKRQQNTFLKLRPKNENLEICLRQGNSTIPDPYISSFADYNGIEVIGTHGHIDTMGWCLVVKIDLSESLEPVNKLKNRIIAFASLIFIFGLTILNLLSSSITNPINKLTEEVDSITHGNLDMRLERSRIKEIQRLTESLNRILSSLKLAILRKGVTKEEIGLGEVIAAKEKAEMQKKEAEERYKTLFESSADAIMTLSPPDWRFKSANKATQKMFGVKDLETFLKYKPYDLSPARQPNGEKSKSKALKMIRAAMKDGTKYFKWTHKRLKGETFPTTVLLTRVKIGEETFLQATVRGIIREEKSDGYTPKQKKKKRGF